MMKRMQRKTSKMKQESQQSALKSSEKWQILEWIWDKFPACPLVDNVTDVDAVAGTMTILTINGTEFTLTMKQGNWREII